MRDQGDLAGAIAEYRKAIALKPDYAEAHYNLGNALRDQGDLPGAVAAYRKAIALKPDYAEAHNNLGNALRDQGDLAGAVAAYRKAIALKPDLAEAHYNLGNALGDQGDLAGAIAAYRKAIALKPDYAEAHNNLGNALAPRATCPGPSPNTGRPSPSSPISPRPTTTWATPFAQGDLPAPSPHTRRPSPSSPISPRPTTTWATPFATGRPARRRRRYRKAIALKPDYAEAHYNLGNALDDQGDLPGAVAAYRKAIALKPDYAEAHCNLGLALQRQGEFQAALTELRRGHELGSRNPRWTYPSAEWVRQCERLVQLDERLPDFLARQDHAGRAPPSGSNWPSCVRLKRLHRAAARFYEEAFAAEPKLADDLAPPTATTPPAPRPWPAAARARTPTSSTTRSAPACAARPWTGCGPTWRRARQLLDKEAEQGPLDGRVAKTCSTGWRTPTSPACAGRRRWPSCPRPNGKPWQKLWDDVADTLARAQAKTAPEKKSGAK